MKLPLAPFTWTTESASVSSKLTNMYVEKNSDFHEYPYSLYSFPGLTEWLDLETLSSIQGMAEMGNNLYVISNNIVFKIDTDGNKTNIGSITGNVERVDISNNYTQVIIINSEGLGFIATSDDVTQITSEGFPSASSVTFLNGYSIVSETGSDSFYYSALDDATSWNALHYAVAEEKPDDLVRVEAYNDSLWLFGTKSISIYYNSEDADTPFQPIQGAVNTTFGLASKYAVSQEDNRLFFLGSDNVVYTNSGYVAKRISNHGIETLIGNLYKDDAVIFFYEYNGHKFLNLIFPTSMRTLSYDLSTKFWSERSSIISSNVSTRWRGDNRIKFAGYELIGGYDNGKIYRIDGTVYDEDGTYFEKVFETVASTKEDGRITWDEVIINLDSGVGLTTGQGSDPQMMMRYSDNGRKTWSNEKWRSLGKRGEYFKRLVWRRMGTSRNRVYRFRVTDSVPVRITGGYANVSVGQT